MKRLSYFLLLLIMVLTACEDLQEMNMDPNRVSETHPQYLLTDVQSQAFQVAGATPLFATRMLVQTDGEEQAQYYTWNRGGFNEYARLRAVTKMIEEAERLENSTYKALGLFFRSYYFYELTLRFGDIPYSEALLGESDEIYTPVYDTQKEVFLGILDELAQANELLKGDNSIIAGDIIYNGSTEKWRRLINSFRLKVLLTLSGKADDTDLKVVSTFQNVYNSEPLMRSIEDNGQLIFLDVSGARYTEFNSSSYGSARYMDSTFIRRLQDHRDPRLFVVAGQTREAKEDGLAIDDFDAYEGGNPIAPYNDVNIKASEGKVSRVNDRYTSDPVNEPHKLLGYSELQLILAEAAARGWISSDPSTYFEQGVKASFAFYRNYVADYAQYFTEEAAEIYLQNEMVDFGLAATISEQIGRIQMQKYFQGFLQGGWTMYYENLRTNYPEFATLSGTTRPLRWMYPTSEYQQNAANVADAIAAQFGSDNDDTHERPWWLK
jgi:hypothetical protein